MPPPRRLTARYALKNKNTNQYIALGDTPQIIVAGKQVGYVNDVPIDTQATFSTTLANSPISVTLPEGSYQFTAFACKYEPKTDVFMRGQGDGGLTTINLTPTDFTGPGVFGVKANLDTYLAKRNKDRAVPVIRRLERSGVDRCASRPGDVYRGRPRRRLSVSGLGDDCGGAKSRDQTGRTLEGRLEHERDSGGRRSSSNARAFGHYLTGGTCGSGDAWGPIYEKRSSSWRRRRRGCLTIRGYPYPRLI